MQFLTDFFVSVVIVSRFGVLSTIVACLHNVSILDTNNLILHPAVRKTCRASLLNRKTRNTSNLSSRIELPLLQSTPVTFLRGSRSARHLDIRRLHVLLRKTCADFLVGLGVGFLAIA